MAPTLEHILDEVLVLDAQGGDRAALELLLRRCSDALYRRARTLCEDEDGAGEVLQRSLVAIARGVHSLDDPRAFGGWCARIVAHKASDWIRARRRDRAHQARVAAWGPGAPEGSEGPGDHRALLRALDSLTPERRALLVLHYGRGLPLAGLSVALGRPVGTIKSRLFKARRDLARALEREAHEPE